LNLTAFKSERVKSGWWKTWAVHMPVSLHVSHSWVVAFFTWIGSCTPFYCGRARL